MSENLQRECSLFWGKLSENFNDAFKSILMKENENLFSYVQDEVLKKGCQENSSKTNRWSEYADRLEKINRVNELQTQLSGSQQNTVMASSLGPAAGIGAGLSLFPLITKFLKR